MKANYLFVLFTAVVLASSCKKENVQPAAAPFTTSAAKSQTLVARWSIAKDSIAASFIGPVHYNVYVGTADDYYDFRADGRCYIKENGTFDTITYKIVSDTTVAFNGSFYDSKVNPLTTHSARIDFMEPQGPGGGTYSKTVFLKK
jgi:hypothetical protein